MNQLQGRTSAPWAFTNGMSGGHWGNANTWDDNARRLGLRVDSVPSVGAIAQTDAGGFGHVAVVTAVNGGQITIEDYSSNFQGSYSQRTASTGSYVYIHVADQGSTNYPDGTFVRDADTGEVFRIAGGAPLYVSTWAAFGGPQPFTNLSHSAITSLRAVPADGGFCGGYCSW